MANPTVDKFKIDNSVYDVQDTQARTDIAKKIDKSTTGDLNQTVTGNMNQTVKGNVKVSANQVEIFSKAGKAFTAHSGVTSVGNTTAPTYIYGNLTLASARETNIDDNYAYVSIGTITGSNTKFLTSRTGKIPSFVEPSPVSIEKYQKLKKMVLMILLLPLTLILRMNLCLFLLVLIK